MDLRLRARFNETYSAERYARYRADLERRIGCEIGFRLAETPVFLPPEFRDACATAAREIVAQLSEPERIARMRGSLPERWTYANETPLPSFAVVDFAAVRSADGRFVPKLIELQGFPSLFAFQVEQRDAWSGELEPVFGDGAWSCWFGGRSRTEYLELLRRTIVGDCDPQCVVLADVEPEKQKTVADFLATKAFFGVEMLDPRALIVRRRKLFRKDAAGREIPVERLYYRTIADELEWHAYVLPFAPRDELDVQWAPHPNWFFIWSKSSLPHLDHPAVPRTRLLSELDELPERLSEDYVLKPLFSFAGVGVNLAPTRADIEKIPERAREGWCLQEKIEYGPAIAAADGGAVKLEIRMMFARPDDRPALELVTNLCRLSRGAMLGVDYNKEKSWVGSSVGIWRDERSGGTGE